jgi:imidazolonepropionase-like amidohydrolase
MKIMKTKYILTIVLSSLFGLVVAQVPTPAEPQSEAILLRGGIAHLGNGEIIENSLIAFDKGKLTLVADATTAKLDIAGYQEVDITGKHVYPGFILPDSDVGLEEVSAVNAMSDSREQGSLNPNVRSLIAYNTDSELPPTFRFNGILMAESRPRGGRISGTSSLMNMDGWNWEDAANTVDLAMHMNWPSYRVRRFDFATYTRKNERNKEYDNQVDALASFFNDAIAYGNISNKERNLKLEAMQGLFDGSKVLMIHSNGPKGIVDAVNMARDKGVKKVALVSGTGSLMVKEFLADNDVPVVIQRVHSLPDRDDMDVDLPYRLPVELTRAGVKVALSHTGMLALARNLPFYAGTAVAYGLDSEEALKLITINPAEILGVGKKTGSLEEGKEATLFVSEGDALDFRTNQLTHAFIQGKQITLDNKQEMLFERYSKKYSND